MNGVFDCRSHLVAHFELLHPFSHFGDQARDLGAWHEGEGRLHLILALWEEGEGVNAGPWSLNMQRRWVHE